MNDLLKFIKQLQQKEGILCTISREIRGKEKKMPDRVKKKIKQQKKSFFKIIKNKTYAFYELNKTSNLTIFFLQHPGKIINRLKLY